MRTLAEICDALTRGELGRVGDLAMQRLKAPEAAHTDGQWALGRHLELIPDLEVSAATQSEREAAAKAELRSVKLREALKGKKAE